MNRTLTLLVLSLTLNSCAPDTTAGGRERAGVPERTEEETAVLLAVERFFETMTAKDAAGARAVVDPEGDFVSVRWNEAGERVVRRAPNQGYLESLAAGTETYVERMWDPEVWVHDPIAVVWTPYDFHIDGEFSHCGIDAFQLLRTEAGWTITSGTYTVERTDCPESPLGAVGA